MYVTNSLGRQRMKMHAKHSLCMCFCIVYVNLCLFFYVSGMCCICITQTFPFDSAQPIWVNKYSSETHKQYQKLYSLANCWQAIVSRCYRDIFACHDSFPRSIASERNSHKTIRVFIKQALKMISHHSIIINDLLALFMSTPFEKCTGVYSKTWAARP